MEGLTKRVDGIAVLESWSIDKDPVSIIQRLCNRLAAYEGTGLEPEQVMELKSFTQGGIHKVDDGWKNVQELLQAEKEARLVVLPCKVGDHVWSDGREAIVAWFFGYKTERYLHAQFFDNAEYTDIPFYEIGKTVFLTCEEALKGGDGRRTGEE